MAGARESVASSTPNGAVALPKRQPRSDGESAAPVWSLDSTASGTADVPLGESASALKLGVVFPTGQGLSGEARVLTGL